MKYLFQLALIFTVCLVGDSISPLLPFTFPPSVISMIIMLFLLLSGALKEHQIKESADFMLSNMAFFFLPLVVGILRYATLVQSLWWQLLVINLVSLFACFVASSWTVVLVKAIQNRVGRNKNV